MQAPKGRALVVCARGRTKKEVWAERIMMDKTKDTHKIQKECERKREEYKIASVQVISKIQTSGQLIMSGESGEFTEEIANQRLPR